MRIFVVVCMFVLLFGSLIISKQFTNTRTSQTAEYLQDVYRKDSDAFSVALADCSRWQQNSCNLAGMCDGAFWGFESMSKSASCVAVETVAKEKGIDFKIRDI